MGATVVGIHLGRDTHANRPAANAAGQPYGALYSCSTHSKVYRTDGSSWSDWADATAGGIASSIVTAKGSMITATAASTPAEHTVPANGMFLQADSSQSDGWKNNYPPGYQFAAATRNANLSVTNTAEASADTLATAGSVTFDGSTPIIVEVFAPGWRPDTGAAGRTITCWLFDDIGGAGANSIGRMAQSVAPAAGTDTKPLLARYALTPSNAAHVFSARFTVSAGSGLVIGGGGGASTDVPAYIRVLRAGGL